jgi:hypothetical protein
MTELRTSRQDLRQNNGANGDGSTNLDLAMRQNNILEARICALERAYVGPQVPDSSPALPPRYQDVALAETTTARPGHRSELQSRSSRSQSPPLATPHRTPI